MLRFMLVPAILVIAAQSAMKEIAWAQTPLTGETIIVSSQSPDTAATFRTRILSGASFITVLPRSQFTAARSSDRPILIFSGIPTPLSVPIQSDEPFVWELAAESSSPGLSIRLRGADGDREILVEGRELVIRREHRGGPLELVAIAR